ncbi:ogr/Delta-like zinc finger family protein [Collimonas pratensis]|uniref:ogr/Delta-like zinc finger family protein n=1 Tax=Collimonas TaxID=202907 RepID=UPI000782E329|nr:ogr/Delta-like zinc finger family protein [Collimonas pratensis]
MRVISIPCPHCHHRVRAANSHTMSDMMMEITYMCKNPECGHIFVAGLEVLRTLSPSAIPDPSVHIQLSKHARSTGAHASGREG